MVCLEKILIRYLVQESDTVCVGIAHEKPSIVLIDLDEIQGGANFRQFRDLGWSSSWDSIK